jgi:hypothetical protein
MVIDLQARELTRRNALWALDNQEKHEQATQDLLSVGVLIVTARSLQPQA